MMRIFIAGFLFIALFISSCSQQKNVVRYEMKEGDPKVDYIEFINDSLCTFVAPGPITLTTHYKIEGDLYIIQIDPLVKASLKRIDDERLQGTPPFFEGIWEKSTHK